MRNKIIVFSGKQLSGKDCAAKILLSYLTEFKRVGLGDAIKMEYSETTGLSLEEIEKNKANYRADLIALGNKRRSEDKDYWIKKVIKLPFNVVVPDMRMKRELEMFRSVNAFTVRVEASLETRQSRGKLSNINDNTETELDNISDWDYIINNDSDINNLKEEIKKLVKHLNEEFLFPKKSN